MTQKGCQVAESASQSIESKQRGQTRFDEYASQSLEIFEYNYIKPEIASVYQEPQRGHVEIGVDNGDCVWRVYT